MDKEKQAEAVAAEQVEETKETKSLEDIKAEIQAEYEARFKEQQEQAKKEIAGLNRKITEQEREKLSDTEKARAELEDLKAEKERIAQEAAELSRKRAIDSALYEAGLPADLFESRILGKNDEEIKADVQKMRAYIDELAEKRSAEVVTNALKGKAPGKQIESGSERDVLIAQYNEAEKVGNVAAMMALKDKIRKLKP